MSPQVRPIGAGPGVRIEGVDLAAPLDATIVGLLEYALVERQVALFS